MNLPYTATIGHALAFAVDRDPDGVCLIADGVSLTFRELDEQSRRLAGRLLAHGVTKGSRVATIFPNGIEWLLTWAAANRLGAVVAPASTFYAPGELKRFLEHADIQHLLLTPTFLKHDYLERLEEIAPSLSRSDTAMLMTPELPQLRTVLTWTPVERAWVAGSLVEAVCTPIDAATSEVIDRIRDAVHPADPALVVYTSGSTSEPKGVVHGHGPLIRHAERIAAMSGYGADRRIWTPMPFFWIGGLHTILMHCLVAGAAVVVHATVDPDEVLATIERERVTDVIAWPATKVALEDRPAFATTDFSSLRSGFEAALPPEHRLADPSLAPLALGMTETAGPYCYFTAEDAAGGFPPERRGAFGYPVDGIELRIVDPDTGADVPAEEEGEILVRGDQMMLGMHKRERVDVFDGDGWYHTGDRGQVIDGWMYFRGRYSDMIKSRGMNVSPAEVSHALALHPDIKQAVVFGVPHADHGEDTVAYVVPWTADDGRPRPITADDAYRHARTELSSYKVPTHIFVVSADDIPWLPNQKINMRALVADATARTRPGPGGATDRSPRG